MKVFAALAVLCILQAIVGQVAKEENKPEQPKPNHQTLANAADQEAHKRQSTQQANKEQHVDQQQVKPTVKVQTQSSDQSKISVEVPPKVQQVVTQVSQHIPQVVTQHVANQQRVVRSVKNRMNWQSMQVNAVEQPGRCQFICNDLDVTVCGYNEQCYWEFASQCDLSTYNCLNTEKIFHVVDFAKCQDVSAAKCYRGDI